MSDINNKLTLQVSGNTDKLNSFINEYKQLINKYGIDKVYWSHDNRTNELILQLSLNELIDIHIEPLRKIREDIVNECINGIDDKEPIGILSEL